MLNYGGAAPGPSNAAVLGSRGRGLLGATRSPSAWPKPEERSHRAGPVPGLHQALMETRCQLPGVPCTRTRLPSCSPIAEPTPYTGSPQKLSPDLYYHDCAASKPGGGGGENVGPHFPDVETTVNVQSGGSAHLPATGFSRTWRESAKGLNQIPA